MKRENENYNNFIKNFFPQSYIIKDGNRDLIYLRVCENNIITEIFEKYIKKNNICCHEIFLKKYRDQFNKILIYVAVNETSGIEFCVRSMIEYLLKFIYSMYFDSKIESISKTSFRNIKDDLKLFYDCGLEINKEKLEIMLNHYGQYSNSIHGKSDKDEIGLEYMSNIIKLPHYDLKKLDDTLIGILDCYEIIMSDILELKENPLSLAETIELKNTVSKKRLKKIISYF